MVLWITKVKSKKIVIFKKDMRQGNYYKMHVVK